MEVRLRFDARGKQKTPRKTCHLSIEVMRTIGVMFDVKYNPDCSRSQTTTTKRVLLQHRTYRLIPIQIGNDRPLYAICSVRYIVEKTPVGLFTIDRRSCSVLDVARTWTISTTSCSEIRMLINFKEP